MRRIFRLFLLSILLGVLSFNGFAQELPFTFFSNSFLEGGEVLAFQQNANKELLFVTREGVFSFNSRHTNRIFDFSKEQVQGIRQALFSSRGLFLLSDEGLVKIDLEKAEKAVVKKGNFEKIFLQPEKENIFLSSKEALLLLKQNGHLHPILEPVDSIEFLTFGEEEIFSVGERNIWVYSYNWELTETIPLKKPVIDSKYKNGRLLLLTADAIWSKESGAGLKKVGFFEKLEPSCLVEDQTGKIWVGTKTKGVLLVDGNQHKVLSYENNFPLTDVKGIYESADFSLWYVGRQGIVYKSFSSPFLRFNLGSAVNGEILSDIHGLDSNRLALLSREGDYHILKNETLQKTIRISLPFVPDFARIIGAQKTIHVSKEGDIFIQDAQKSFRLSLDKTIQQVLAFKGQTLLVDEKGSLFSVDHKTYKLRKKEWAVMPARPLFQNGQALIYTDAEGRIKKWDSQQNRHELVGDFIPEMENVALFGQKHLVFVTKDRQLKYRIEGEQGHLEVKMDPHEQIKSFFIAGSELWVSTEDTLYQISLRLKENQLVVQESRIFPVQQNNIQLPVLKSVPEEEGSSFWLAAKRSVLLYNTLALVPDISPPGIVLEQVFIKGKDSVINVPVYAQDTLHIVLQENDQLLIHAFAVNYDRKDPASLTYRFLSNEGQWKEASSKDLILISGLGAGTHVVELASINEQGVKSRNSFIFKIKVEQPVWYQWWTLLGVSVSLMMVGYFAYSGIRSVKGAKEKEAQEKFEKELRRLQKKGHEQMMKAEGLKQMNEMISAQKTELEDKNKQIVAQKYELSLTNDQIKQQKDLIEKTSEKLQSSINYAQKIQTALMADEIQIKEDLPESFVFFKARDQVSGDFFWFDKTHNEQGDKNLIMAAVDCTGHGVPGAIVSVVGIQLLNAIVKAKAITDPGQILTQLNLDMLDSLKYEQTKINDGMDMSLCSINLDQGRLYFAGAKNPLYIVEEGQLEVIKGDKFPIGGQKLKDEKVFRTHEIMLKGSGKQMFYLFSDGYQDQFGGAKNSKFLTKNFKSLLIELSDKPMMEQKYMLAKTLREWQGEESQTDDILVMVFKIKFKSLLQQINQTTNPPLMLI